MLFRQTIKSICFSLLLIFTQAGSVQDKPAFIAEIEQVFQEKAPGWKVESKIDQNGSAFFKQETVYKSGKAQAVVSITVWQREKDASDVFEASAIAFDNIAGVHKVKKSLPDLGDENYIWVNRGNNAWPTIHFRKGSVYVTLFAPSIAVAKRFARYVAERIPSSGNLSDQTPQ